MLYKVHALGVRMFMVSVAACFALFLRCWLKYCLRLKISCYHVFFCVFRFFSIMLIVCVLHAYCMWCVLGVCMLFVVGIALIDRVRDRDCLCDECVLLLSLLCACVLVVSVCVLYMCAYFLLCTCL